MSLSLSGFKIPRVALAFALASLGALLLASSASAACSYPDAEQVFSRFDDEAYYQLAPDGGLEEGGSGWTLAGGATLVAGNETHFLGAAADDTSLRLPYGGKATSPRVCVDESTPHFRLMSLNTGDDHAKLRVVVTYELPRETKTRTTEFRAANKWAPTQELQLDIDGDDERVARISFTPSDRSGAWLIDDLYIDPFARR